MRKLPLPGHEQLLLSTEMTSPSDSRMCSSNLLPLTSGLTTRDHTICVASGIRVDMTSSSHPAWSVFCASTSMACIFAAVLQSLLVTDTKVGCNYCNRAPVPPLSFQLKQTEYSLDQSKPSCSKTLEYMVLGSRAVCFVTQHCYSKS